MSKKANPAVIGAFVVGAVLLAVAGTLSFGGGTFLTKKDTYVMFFEGASLQGLDVGAPVNFRGVRIGAVSSIIVRVNTDTNVTRIPVYVAIEPNRVERVGTDRRLPDPKVRLDQLIEQGMRAQLVMGSLVTGKLAIQLDFHPDKPVNLIREEPDYPEVPTIPSLMEELQQLPIKELINDTQDAIAGINSFIQSGKLDEIVDSVNATLAEYRKLAKSVDAQVQPVVSDIQSTTAAVRAALQDARERVASAETVVEETLRAYEKLAQKIDGQVDPIAGSFSKLLVEARKALQQLQETMASLEEVTGRDSPLHYKLVEALGELGAASRSVRVLADYLERHPEALLQGKPSSGGF